MLIDETTYAPGKQATVVEPPLRPLKPSEAMRIGAALRPQCQGAPFRDGGSCAMGAAWEGYGFKHTGDFNRQTSFPSPVYEAAASIGIWWMKQKLPTVWRKNDVDGMTREQIADWLEGQGF